jgi:hypothetical protein
MPGQNQIPRQLEPLMRALLGGGPPQGVVGPTGPRGPVGQPGITGPRGEFPSPAQMIAEANAAPVGPAPGYPAGYGAAEEAVFGGQLNPDGSVGPPMPPPGPVGAINRDTGPSPGQYSGMMEALGGMMGGPPIPPRPRRRMPTSLESPRTDPNYRGSLEEILRREYGQ